MDLCWNGRFFSDSKNMMRNIDVNQREHECSVVEMRFPVFILCMGKRFIKVVCKKKIKNVKEI